MKWWTRQSKRREGKIRRSIMEPLEQRQLLSAITDLRVVCYNIAADINGATTAPQPAMETVLEGIGSEQVNGLTRPIDILALEETTSNTTTVAPIVTQLNAHYGAGTYAYSTYQATEDAAGPGDGNGPNALIYNTHTLTLLASVGIGTPSGSGFPRQPVRYEFEPVNGTSADVFYVYVDHYKSGDANSGSPTNATRRNIEAQAIRADELNNLPANARVLYVGDYNIDASTEASYQTMLAAGQGQAFDPINSPGSFDGAGCPVGTMTEFTSSLASRLDFQLVTQNVLSDPNGLEYVSGSYHPFGNDGKTPLGGTITGSSTALANLPNRATVLTDLGQVSDHLPLVADYTDTVSGTLPVPSIGSITASPSSVTASVAITLTANNVTETGGTVSAVNFYLESNGTPGLQIGSDTLEGSGTANGTTWTLSNVSTTGFAPAHIPIMRWPPTALTTPAAHRFPRR